MLPSCCAVLRAFETGFRGLRLPSSYLGSYYVSLAEVVLVGVKNSHCIAPPLLLGDDTTSARPMRARTTLDHHTSSSHTTRTGGIVHREDDRKAWRYV
jgi:hypothetical protein